MKTIIIDLTEIEGASNINTSSANAYDRLIIDKGFVTVEWCNGTESDHCHWDSISDFLQDIDDDGTRERIAEAIAKAQKSKV